MADENYVIFPDGGGGGGGAKSVSMNAPKFSNATAL